MERLTDTTLQALAMLLSGDPDLWSIVGISFGVSLRAILFIVPPALLLAFWLAYTRFPGRRVLLSTMQSLLSVPAVVVGLTVYLLLSRQGPLGNLHLLFTQKAMVIGQMLLGFPVVVAMGHAAFQAGERRAWETARTLGAGPLRAFLTLLHELRYGLLVAVLAAFGRIVSEVGVSMMVGGNILDHTRNIPTAIALETSKGEFAQGIALGIVLVAMAFSLNFLLSWVQGKGHVMT
jgi:tungstate transport system permease protein